MPIAENLVPQTSTFIIWVIPLEMGPSLDAAVILMAWSCAAVPVLSPGIHVPHKTVLKRMKNFSPPINAPLSRTTHFKMKQVCKCFQYVGHKSTQQCLASRTGE